MPYTVKNLTAQKIDLTLRNSKDDTTVALSLKPRETKEGVEIEDALAAKLNGYGAVHFFVPQASDDAPKQDPAPQEPAKPIAQGRPQTAPQQGKESAPVAAP